MEKILKHLKEILLLATVLFLPLVMFPFSGEIFEHNKFTFLYLVVAILLLISAFQKQMLGRIILQFDAITLMILLRFAFILPSVVLAPNHFNAIHGVLGRLNGGLVSELIFLFLFFIFRVHFVAENKSQRLEKIFKISVLTSMIVVLIGGFGYFGKDLICKVLTNAWTSNCWGEAFDPRQRMFATLGQPNWLGIYFACNFLFLQYFFLERKAYWKKTLSILGLIILGFGIYATHSRSALLAITVAQILVFVAYFSRNWRFRQILITSIIASTLFGISLFCSLLIFGKSNPNERLTPDPVSSSIEIRSNVYKSAVVMWQAYPLFGVGRENFGFFYPRFKTKQANYTSEWDYLYNKAHNEYLSELSNSGIFAFLGIILLIVVALSKVINELIVYKGNHQNYYQNLILGSCLVAIVSSNVFGFSTSTISMFWIIILAYLAQGRSLGSLSLPKSRFVTFSTQMVFICLGIILTIYTLRFWKADYFQQIATSTQDQTAYFALIDSVENFPHPEYELKLTNALINNFIASENPDEVQPLEKYVVRSLESLSKSYPYSPSISRQVALTYGALAQATENPKYYDNAWEIATNLCKFAKNEPRFFYLRALIDYQRAQTTVNTDSKNYYLLRSFASSQTAYQLKKNWAQNIELQKNILIDLNQPVTALAKLQILRKMSPANQELILQELELIKRTNN